MLSFNQQTNIYPVLDYVFDFFKKQNPPPREIITGSQGAIMGGINPLTPNELNKNDIT